MPACTSGNASIARPSSNPKKAIAVYIAPTAPYPALPCKKPRSNRRAAPAARIHRAAPLRRIDSSSPKELCPLSGESIASIHISPSLLAIPQYHFIPTPHILTTSSKAIQRSHSSGKEQVVLRSRLIDIAPNLHSTPLEVSTHPHGQAHLYTYSSQTLKERLFRNRNPDRQGLYREIHPCKRTVVRQIHLP